MDSAASSSSASLAAAACEARIGARESMATFLVAFCFLRRSPDLLLLRPLGSVSGPPAAGRVVDGGVVSTGVCCCGC